MSSPDTVAEQDAPLHRYVYALVRDNISSGRLPPGTLLTENGLANQFALSRDPVGRALHRLEIDGLIARAPRLRGR